MCVLGKTAELIDAEGYVLSGDLGRFDKEYIVFYCIEMQQSGLWGHFLYLLTFLSGWS